MAKPAAVHPHVVVDVAEAVVPAQLAEVVA